ncbi:hypothetical protein EB796_020309 [Bugula neritina]|uniref:MSP domain-containing protein n=1 Tax=Bugula neritina TaxID=10212 RepID=A0A7J7J6U8_BUGNE|nr:hypothetical protein EB796_020309 [Bugula neritina]
MARLNDFLPVFIFPQKLEFFMDDVTTFKSTLSIYNPYNFPLRYKLKRSVKEENKYQVSEPEGVVKSHCCVDLVIRHQQPYLENVGTKDVFRIKIIRDSDKKHIAQQDVPATLYRSRDEHLQAAGVNRQGDIRRPGASRQTESRVTPPRETPDQAHHSSDSDGVPPQLDPLVVIIGLVCLLVLALPYQGEDNYYLPEYVRTTESYRLSAAFFLGMVVLYIFIKR